MSKSVDTGNDVLFSPAGLQQSETALREVVAYRLDRNNFYGVPATALARITHPMLGSGCVGTLQEFVENIGDEVGPQLFPVADVQKIAILDVRIFNMDRHSENILVQQHSSSASSPSSVPTCRLIPIDHGFSLPDHVADDVWFHWLSWRQSKQPLSHELKAHVAAIDIDNDAALLQSLGVRHPCIRVMKVSGYGWSRCKRSLFIIFLFKN
jgi:hypothetical protein